MTPAQSRAARALLGWSQTSLANAASLSLSTIVDHEKERRVVSAEAIAAIRKTVQSAGIEFIDDERGEGVVKLRATRLLTSKV